MTTRPTALEYEPATAPAGVPGWVAVGLCVNGGLLAAAAAGSFGWSLWQAISMMPPESGLWLAGFVLLTGGHFAGFALTGLGVAAGGAGLLAGRAWGRGLAGGLLLITAWSGTMDLAWQLPRLDLSAGAALAYPGVVLLLCVVFPAVLFVALVLAGDGEASSLPPGAAAVAYGGLIYAAVNAAGVAGTLCSAAAASYDPDMTSALWWRAVTCGVQLAAACLTLGRWRAGPILFLLGSLALPTWLAVEVLESAMYDDFPDARAGILVQAAAWAVGGVAIGVYAHLGLARANRIDRRIG